MRLFSERLNKAFRHTRAPVVRMPLPPLAHAGVGVGAGRRSLAISVSPRPALGVAPIRFLLENILLPAIGFILSNLFYSRFQASLPPAPLLVLAISASPLPLTISPPPPTLTISPPPLTFGILPLSFIIPPLPSSTMPTGKATAEFPPPEAPPPVLGALVNFIGECYRSAHSLAVTKRPAFVDKAYHSASTFGIKFKLALSLVAILSLAYISTKRGLIFIPRSVGDGDEGDGLLPSSEGAGCSSGSEGGGGEGGDEGEAASEDDYSDDFHNPDESRNPDPDDSEPPDGDPLPLSSWSSRPSSLPNHFTSAPEDPPPPPPPGSGAFFLDLPPRPRSPFDWVVEFILAALYVLALGHQGTAFSRFVRRVRRVGYRVAEGIVRLVWQAMGRQARFWRKILQVAARFGYQVVWTGGRVFINIADKGARVGLWATRRAGNVGFELVQKVAIVGYKLAKIGARQLLRGFVDMSKLLGTTSVDAWTRFSTWAEEVWEETSSEETSVAKKLIEKEVRDRLVALASPSANMAQVDGVLDSLGHQMTSAVTPSSGTMTALAVYTAVAGGALSTITKDVRSRIPLDDEELEVEEEDILGDTMRSVGLDLDARWSMDEKASSVEHHVEHLPALELQDPLPPLVDINPPIEVAARTRDSGAEEKNGAHPTEQEQDEKSTLAFQTAFSHLIDPTLLPVQEGARVVGKVPILEGEDVKGGMTPQGRREVAILEALEADYDVCMRQRCRMTPDTSAKGVEIVKGVVEMRVGPSRQWTEDAAEETFCEDEESTRDGVVTKTTIDQQGEGMGRVTLAEDLGDAKVAEEEQVKRRQLTRRAIVYLAIGFTLAGAAAAMARSRTKTRSRQEQAEVTAIPGSSQGDVVGSKQGNNVSEEAGGEAAEGKGDEAESVEEVRGPTTAAEAPIDEMCHEAQGVAPEDEGGGGGEDDGEGGAEDPDREVDAPGVGIAFTHQDDHAATEEVGMSVDDGMAAVEESHSMITMQAGEKGSEDEFGDLEPMQEGEADEAGAGEETDADGAQEHQGQNLARQACGHGEESHVVTSVVEETVEDCDASVSVATVGDEDGAGEGFPGGLASGFAGEGDEEKQVDGEGRDIASDIRREEGEMQVGIQEAVTNGDGADEARDELTLLASRSLPELNAAEPAPWNMGRIPPTQSAPAFFPQTTLDEPVRDNVDADFWGEGAILQSGEEVEEGLEPLPEEEAGDDLHDGNSAGIVFDDGVGSEGYDPTQDEGAGYGWYDEEENKEAQRRWTAKFESSREIVATSREEEAVDPAEEDQEGIEMPTEKTEPCRQTAANHEAGTDDDELKVAALEVDHPDITKTSDAGGVSNVSLCKTEQGLASSPPHTPKQSISRQSTSPWAPTSSDLSDALQKLKNADADLSPKTKQRRGRPAIPGFVPTSPELAGALNDLKSTSALEPTPAPRFQLPHVQLRRVIFEPQNLTPTQTHRNNLKAQLRSVLGNAGQTNSRNGAGAAAAEIEAQRSGKENIPSLCAAPSPFGPSIAIARPPLPSSFASPRTPSIPHNRRLSLFQVAMQAATSPPKPHPTNGTSSSPDRAPPTPPPHNVAVPSRSPPRGSAPSLPSPPTAPPKPAAATSPPRSPEKAKRKTGLSPFERRRQRFERSTPSRNKASDRLQTPPPTGGLRGPPLPDYWSRPARK